MKRIFAIGIICFLFFINIGSVLAGDNDAKSLFKSSLDSTAKGTGHLNTKISKLGAYGTASLLIQILLSIIGVLFLILMIWGGFIWMNSRGVESEVTRAKDIIRNSIIGLIIIIAAYAITNFIGNNLLNEFSK